MKRTPLKKKSKTKISTLKRKLWALVSEYVRRKEDGECFTCGRKKPWKEMQSGHCTPKSMGNAAYWDEGNIHVQCYNCNINLGGNGAEYIKRIEERFGKDEAERVRNLRHQTVKYDEVWYIERIAYYQNKLSEL